MRSKKRVSVIMRSCLLKKDTKDVNDVHYSISDDNKAGVSDYDGSATLKSQVLKESRTSAFAIEPDETPLYRIVSTLLSLKATKVTRLIHYVSSRNIVKSTCKLRTTRIS